MYYKKLIWKHKDTHIVSGVVPPPVCEDLDDPTYGEVRLQGLQVGHTATYSCDSGFILQGQGARVCQVDGNWSGSAPTCKKY